MPIPSMDRVHGGARVPFTDRVRPMLRMLPRPLRLLPLAATWAAPSRTPACRRHGAGPAGSLADFHDPWGRILAWYQTHVYDAAVEDRPVPEER
jgi:hypothetical protein